MPDQSHRQQQLAAEQLPTSVFVDTRRKEPPRHGEATVRLSALPERDRPRERAAAIGITGLSNDELVMVMLGSGSAQYPVHRTAVRVRDVLEKKGLKATREDLCEIPGIGEAKATLILASFELARRVGGKTGIRVRNCADILPLVHDIRGKSQEHFVVISLNGNHEVLHSRVVTVGLANMCQVHPREVFADVLTDRATAVIVAHNHPSQHLAPSPEDLDVTRRLVRAAELLGLKFLDHVIFTKHEHLSIRETNPAVFSQ